MDIFPAKSWFHYGLVMLLALISACAVDENPPERVMEIVSVDLATQFNGDVEQLTIRAQANVSSAAWSNPKLIPLEQNNGVYSYEFVAVPPSDPAAAVITPITASLTLQQIPADLVSVRVLADTNEVSAELVRQVRQQITEINSLTLNTVPGQRAEYEIVASGTVPDSGWGKPSLVAWETLLPPADGIYDYTFYAIPPSHANNDGAQSIKVTSRINAIPKGFKGVRVHAANNSLEALLQTTPPTSQLVMSVDGVQLLFTKSLPPQLTIVADGRVTTAGWSGAALQPYVYIQPPQDGIYDFGFTAIPPSQPAADVITKISASYQYGVVPSDVKGFRVHSASNDIVAMLDNSTPGQPPVLSDTILDIKKVKLYQSAAAGVMGWNIYALGDVTSGGWSNPVLIPYNYFTVPQDGIYDFTFVASPPTGPAAAVIADIETSYFLGTLGADIKGYRIHGRNNSIEYLLNSDPNLSPCNYVVGRQFDTVERLDAGFSAPGVQGLFRTLVFKSDGSFQHTHAGLIDSGTYLCDNTGFHMLDLKGGDYFGGVASVDIANERVNLPEGTFKELFYYRVAQ